MLEKDLIKKMDVLINDYGDIALSKLRSLIHIETIKKDNKYFKCLSCNGLGFDTIVNGYKKERCSDEQAMILASYEWSMTPAYTYVYVPIYGDKACKYCLGKGYIEKELTGEDLETIKNLKNKSLDIIENK